MFDEKKYNEAVKFLDEIPQFVENTGVWRTEKMLAAMGNPENELKIIHVAGTNGKGSTCAYMESVLSANGYSVGLFTSPHLTDIRERIQFGRSLISKELFLEGFEAVKTAQDKLYADNVRLAYFDWLMGIAIYAFSKENVDFVVMETGLGGRLDGTNAVKNPIISCITTISLEHTALLGETIEEIAYEKAGIVKAGVPLVCMYGKEQSKVFEEICKKKGSRLIEVNPKECQIDKITSNYIDFSIHNGYYKNDCFKVATCAVYQVYNSTLALMVMAVLEEKGIITLDSSISAEAVYNTLWSGRMEQVALGIYVDGAHNPEGVNSIIQSIRYFAMDKKKVLLFSVVSDKNYEEMIKALCESDLFDCFVLTEVAGSRRLAAGQIRAVFEQYTDKPVTVFEHIDEAFYYGKKQMQLCDGLMFCMGSLYLIGDIKKLLN